MSTEKKRSILLAALQLFADHGYHATSTSKIAKAAGVSEGLIFRHFENKEGLLNALIELSGEKMEAVYTRIQTLPSAEVQLKAILSIPFEIEESEHGFWKLLYGVKWQTGRYDSSKMAPMKALLEKIFEELAYPSPADEAETVLALLDGMAAAVLLRKPNNIAGMHRAILSKYKL